MVFSQEEFEAKLDEVSEDEFENTLFMMLDEGVRVEISNITQEILKVFQKINKSIVFLDSETSTCSPDGKIFAMYENFKMPISFALQQLNKLILGIKSVKTDEIIIHMDHILITHTDENGKTREVIVHHHDNFDLVKSPAAAYINNNMDNMYEMMQLDPNFEDSDISFKINTSDIKNIKEANKIMQGKHNEIIFSFKPGLMSTSISDENEGNGDLWREESPIEYDGEEFDLVYPSSLLEKLVSGSYTCYAYDAGITGFRLDPIEVDGEMIDLGLTYIATIGTNQ